MKIEFRDNDLIVFLNKEYTSEIDFLNKIELEEYFKKLFIKFKDIYGIDISGSYEIEVYIDTNYGVILKLIKDELEYFDYYEGQIDMKIVISKTNTFLYKLIGNINKTSLLDTKIYLYGSDFYILPTCYNYLNMGQIIENSEIIYGNEAQNIISNAKIIDINKYCF